MQTINRLVENDHSGLYALELRNTYANSMVKLALLVTYLLNQMLTIDDRYLLQKEDLPDPTVDYILL